MTGVRSSNQPAGPDPEITSSKEEDLFIIPFEDNRLIADLLGEYDSNLAIIEDRLGVEAVAHGNVVTLKGPEFACNQAKTVLKGLYDRLSEGEIIGPGEIDGAIRHADTGETIDRNRSKAKKVRSEDENEDLNKLERIKTRKRTITARTPMQGKFIRALDQDSLVFATGPAGTGKTYLAVAHAAAALERGESERLILSRPAVEAGERLGFLPGDMKDKVDPYLRPLYDALYDVLPAEKVQRGLDNGSIEIAPLAFMRGRTLANAMIILDEAQNCTAMQMKMFLTRLGENSKMVVTGDPTQVDLPGGQTSGLNEAIALLSQIDEVGHISFTNKDVVRRKLVAEIVEAYDKKISK